MPARTPSTRQQNQKASQDTAPRNLDGLEPMPADFWRQTEIERASRQNHFGYLLRAYRELQVPPVKQAQLAEWLGITQGQVSRIERGASSGQDLKKLVTWATILGIPQQVLWFDLRQTDDAPCTDAHYRSRSNIESEDSESDDVNRRQLLKTAGLGAVLLGSNANDPTISTTPTASSRNVGNVEIDSLRYWTDIFRQADNRYGGGESLDQARHFVTSRVVPLLQASRCSAKIRNELFSAAAELYQLTGWMSYDTSDKTTGRKCLQQALRLCQEAGNQALAAEMLAGMSHQAAFLHASDEAVDLALAARQMALRSGEPALISEAAVMEAHGLALQGDTKACIAALQEAEDQFCRVRIQNIPLWLRYFDQAYLSAKFGHTLRDLGQPVNAERFARQSLRMTNGYERGRAFNTALIAGVLADKGDLDESVAYAQQALHLFDNIRSTRAVSYMTDVAYRLNRFNQDIRVQSLYKNMACRRIPLSPAS